MVGRRRRAVIAVVTAIVVPSVALSAPEGTAPPPRPVGDELRALAAPPLRSALSGERIYFVMTDRFANADTANDRGGKTGGFAVTGYEPSDIGAYHGGDLKGLADKLGYVKSLGFTAIWVTPPFVNRTVQGTSAGYHGYWGTDFTDVDPHLGTKADFKAFVDGAHALGLKVMLDVVLNHTADVITYAGAGALGAIYVETSKRPYRDVRGRPFDPAKVAGRPAFPQLYPDRRSFPYQPRLAPADRNVKKPAWLNDLRNYHNRGETTFSGESLTYGDLFGLDDLFTEKPAVSRGLTELYAGWIREFRLDGLRIDTVRHVDPQLWRTFLPAMRRAASQVGVRDFSMFGEVFDPAATAGFVRAKGLPSVLDFSFQAAAFSYAVGAAGAEGLETLFAGDDLYTTAGSTAYDLVTFLGNHDMGRIGYFVAQGRGDAVALRSDLLAHELLFLLRGAPVVYYGDEVGMTGGGDGKDKLARQDMFPTRVEQWRTERRIGAQPVGDRESFDLEHPLARQIARLNALRAEHTALRNGAQIIRFVGRGKDAPVLAVSRIDVKARVEYVVAFNNGPGLRSVTVSTASPGTAFATIWPGRAPGPTSDAAGALRVTVPARGAVVLRAEKPLPEANVPRVVLASPSLDRVAGLVRLSAVVPGRDPASVTFATRRAGERHWIRAGTDDAPPFRIYLEEDRLSKGKQLYVVAVARNSSGAAAASSIARFVRR